MRMRSLKYKEVFPCKKFDNVTNKLLLIIVISDEACFKTELPAELHG